MFPLSTEGTKQCMRARSPVPGEVFKDSDHKFCRKNQPGDPEPTASPTRAPSASPTPEPSASPTDQPREIEANTTATVISALVGGVAAALLGPGAMALFWRA